MGFLEDFKALEDFVTNFQILVHKILTVYTNQDLGSEHGEFLTTFKNFCK